MVLQENSRLMAESAPEGNRSRHGILYIFSRADEKALKSFWDTGFTYFHLPDQD
jgi:hypothetical protein